MKLEIDLADREEVAAAVPLLQLILDNTAGLKTCGGQCRHEVPKNLGVTSTPQDPAAVFGGGAQPAVPLAPSIPPAPALATSAPPAPVTFAPTTTMPGPVSSGVPAASVELDSRGLPWDERIHASTKTQTVKGEWKAKRGVVEELVASVEAELRGRVAAPAAPATLPSAPVVTPAIPVAPAVPPAPTPAAALPDPGTFEQLMPRITAAVTAGVMPPTAVGAACAAHGAASVVTLQQSPQFVPLVWASLKQQFPGLQ